MIKENKLKRLNPTLRQKKRFIKIKIDTKENNLDFKTIQKSLNKQLIHYIGVIDFSKEGVWLQKPQFNKKSQELVIKCSTKLKDKTITALSLIEQINQSPAKITIQKISGTLKGLKE